MSLSDRDARRTAVTDFRHNLVVSAGAGTGKTSLLVGRFAAALLREHMEVGTVLAVTFTENAAAEMRERLVRLLRAVPRFLGGEEIEASDRAILEAINIGPEHRRAAAEHLANADRFRISTFHGFCLRFLQQHARQLDLPPALVLGEVQATREAFDRAFLAHVGAQTETALAAAMQHGDLEHLAEFAWRMLAVPDAESPPDARVALEFVSLRRDRLTQLLAELPGARAAFRAAVEACLACCNALLRGDGSLVPAVPEATPAAGKRELGGELADRATAELETIRRDLRPFAGVHPAALERVLDFVRPFVRAHRREREQRGEVAFQDLLLLARERLQAEPALREAAGRELCALLVDEFQDTDPLQYDIVFLLAAQPCAGRVETPLALPLRPGVLFLVGDAKQSIYRFRRADVAAYARTVQQVVAQGGIELTLAANFRSRPPILEFTNTVCAKSLAQAPPYQWGYTPLEATRAPSPAAGVEIRRLPDCGDLSAGARRDQEGQAVVCALQELHAQGVPFGDIAVLLRAAVDLAWLLRPLRAARIPYVLEGSRRFYDRHEVVTATALVQAMACPHDPVAVLGVLRSALGGVTDAEIHAWRQAGHSLDFRLPAAAPGPVAETLRRLHALWSEVQALPCEAALTRLVLGQELRESEAAGFEGAQRLANLERLVARLVAAAPLDLETAAGFLLRRNLRPTDDEESPLFDASLQAVRVLTVHKAKGLEFPVVLLPDIARPQNAPGGPGVRAVVERMFTTELQECLALRLGSAKNLACAWLEAERQRQDEAEQRRLFYVATTRAKERLVLFDTVKDDAKAVWQRDLRAAGATVEPLVVLAQLEVRSARGEEQAFAPAPVYAAMQALPQIPEPAPAPAAARRPLDPAAIALGTAIHEYLACVALERDAPDATLLAAVAAQAGVDLAALQTLASAFHVSTLRREAAAANPCLREVPVYHAGRAGVLDLAYADATGAWTIVDYKTDLEIAPRAHASQLGAYADALLAALGLQQRPRLLLFYVRHGKVVPV